MLAKSSDDVAMKFLDVANAFAKDRNVTYTENEAIILALVAARFGDIEHSILKLIDLNERFGTDLINVLKGKL